ncbi:D-alanyl-D-alanine carboxypeptidase family protein [Halarsenatibacter silvermanii]|uniref:serine-type D-Ala-D-Ala carboxypeptidase n=1 Tax=Halarsenatibacter silvermanii TaxID=321763 RepID=A0A1G9KP09_9FIRM|nr:D-alanyl-D-alanine carboxypeptidase family protein [Halarsenatibacter silvermanii]SDL51264.1 D-Ala-D-Ala carboxypeptidase DacF. Serine peptidase. MEROPS family S11 [Halarsenatibacter silvermanii]
MKSRFIKLTGLTLLLLAAAVIISTPASAIELQARSAILVEANTGQVLYEQNPDEELPPASITKIMPMLMAMEAVEEGEISLDDEVTVSSRAEDMGGSQIFLEAGTALTVEELLKAITISSANDATYALSEYLGGTYSGFIEMMNERVAELGMENTNFENSTGLPADNHYSTARDIAKMSREVVQYPEIREWGQIWSEYLELPDREALLANLNQLVRDYPGMDGIKTGRTQEAGYCLAASAEREGMRLISVVLNAESDQERQDQTRKLLDYGFGNYVQETVIEEGDSIQNISFPGSSEEEVSARAAEDLTALRERGEDLDYDREVSIIEDFEFPIAEGEKMGEMRLVDGDEIINSIDLIAEEDIVEAGIVSRIIRSVGDIVDGIFE